MQILGKSQANLRKISGKPYSNLKQIQDKSQLETTETVGMGINKHVVGQHCWDENPVTYEYGTPILQGIICSGFKQIFCYFSL